MSWVWYKPSSGFPTQYGKKSPWPPPQHLLLPLSSPTTCLCSWNTLSLLLPWDFHTRTSPFPKGSSLTSLYGVILDIQSWPMVTSSGCLPWPPYLKMPCPHCLSKHTCIPNAWGFICLYETPNRLKFQGSRDRLCCGHGYISCAQHMAVAQ